MFSIFPYSTYKGLLFQLWSSTIEHKHRLDVIVKELTDSVEEYHQMSVRDWFSVSITDTLHCLVQPDTYV